MLIFLLGAESMEISKRVYLPIATVLLLAFVVFAARYYSSIDGKNIIAYICEDKRCTLQDWLAATSGLIACVAAAIGAYLVFGQLSEQRKQTAFALGDLPPSLELSVGAGENRRATFELVNWNRRRITIRNVSISGAGEGSPLPWAILFNSSESQGQILVRLTTAYSMSRYVTVGGWLDRQKAPNVLKFSIVFDQFSEDYTNLISSIRGTVPRAVIRVGYELDGKYLTVDQELNIIGLFPHRGLNFVLI